VVLNEVLQKKPRDYGTQEIHDLLGELGHYPTVWL